MKVPAPHRRSLAEFAARRRQKSEIIFLWRHVRQRKYRSGCKCGICVPSAHKFCAQQTVTRPTTEELARRALESVARAHGVSVADVHAAVRGAAEHTKALGALAPEELVAYLAHKSRTGSRNGSRFFACR